MNAMPGTPPAAPGRICFITTEFHGLFKNGGIGTSNTGLALALAANGFDVTVAFANADENGPRVKSGNFAELQAHYLTRGITLDFVPPHAAGAFNDPRSASFSVFVYLAAHRFDVVLFNDNGGQGYYALQAKRCGLFPNAPSMIVVTHGPFDWVLELNAMEYWGREPIIAGFMEKSCAGLADVLVSPSRYLVGWMQARGWRLADRTEVIQNLIGADLSPARVTPGASPAGEIVFFGRQEFRKGLALFCDALDLLAARADLSGLVVTFLGKFSKLGTLHSGIYLLERSLKWPVTVRFAVDLDQAAALDYLGRPGVLAVIPSLAENSPCVVAECLQLGLPFLATDSGGTAELVAPDSRPTSLFAPTASDLAARLDAALDGLPEPACLATSQEETCAVWVALLHQEVARIRNAGLAAPAVDGFRPLISVCLSHSQAHPATACLASVLAQRAERIEVLLAWDGVASLDGVPAGGKTVRVIETRPADLGTARNAAAAAATGDHLLFIDPDGVTLLPGSLATLSQAAICLGADILTAMPVPDPAGLSTPSQAYPVGGCAELGGFENCFGQGILLVSAEVLRGRTGFMSAESGEALDWLFLATCILRGHTLEVVPAQLYQCQRSAPPGLDAGQAVLRHRQVIAAYAQTPAAVFSHIIEGLMRFTASGNESLPLLLKHTSAGAIEVAKRLAVIDANGNEAMRAFVNYCCERRQAAMALDFAMLNGGLNIIDAAAKTARLAGADALAAIRQRPLDTLHPLDLSNDVANRVRATAPLRAADLARPKPGVVAHDLSLETVILKAAGTCPPGLLRVRAQVMRQDDTGDRVEVALAVCDPHKRLRLAETLHADGGKALWSGWTDLPPGSTGAEVTLQLVTPLGELFDLFLLSRRREPAFGRASRLVWTRVTADLQVTATTTPSRISRSTTLSTLPVDVMRAGRLLTDVSRIGFAIFLPGERTLLHPTPGAVSLVLLAEAFPAAATALRARIGVENDRAHPVDFAMWVLPPQARVENAAELPEGPGFSGWFTIFEPGPMHFLELELPAPSDAAMDIYIATRASHSQDVHFCHAYWYEMLTIEPVTQRRQVVLS